MKAISVLYLTLLLFIAACAPKGPYFAELEPAFPALAPDHSRIVFYRDSVGGDTRVHCRLKLNDKVIGKIKNETFNFLDVTPGNQTIETDNKWRPGSFKLAFVSQPNQTYFIRISARRAASVAGTLFGTLGKLVEETTNDDGKGSEFQIDLVSDSHAKKDMEQIPQSPLVPAE